MKTQEYGTHIGVEPVGEWSLQGNGARRGVEPAGEWSL